MLIGTPRAGPRLSPGSVRGGGNRARTSFSKKPINALCCSNEVTRGTILDVSLHHYAHVIMLEHSETFEQGRCLLGTQDVLPERESEAQDEDVVQECCDNVRLRTSPSRTMRGPNTRTMDPHQQRIFHISV
ncbi:hypothetical protein TNCV_4069451 [Trichonephila clavipes]|nr:hypothetical protein TNCV_4069451 [Trichonephila clavipes]